MAKFLTHESIGDGMFSREHCTASTSHAAWQEYLLNSTQLLELLCERLRHDWLATPIKFRKAWNGQQIVSCSELASHPFWFSCHHMVTRIRCAPNTCFQFLFV